MQICTCNCILKIPKYIIPASMLDILYSLWQLSHLQFNLLDNTTATIFYRATFSLSRKVSFSDYRENCNFPPMLHAPQSCRDKQKSKSPTFRFTWTTPHNGTPYQLCSPGTYSLAVKGRKAYKKPLQIIS